jgi:hypothetical protein
LIQTFERRFPVETRNDQSKHLQPQPEPPKKLKSRLERWIEKLEERIAPCLRYQCGQGNSHFPHGPKP